MYVKLLKEKQMKKGLKIAAIVVGVIIILMLLLPFAFQGKIAGIVKTEGNLISRNSTLACSATFRRLLSLSKISG